MCLIEAGGEDRHPFIQVPALVGAAIVRPELNWRFMTDPQPQLNNRRIPLPRGHVIGGSGSINGMAYFRGQPKDFDDWAATGNPGWSYREVLPYFHPLGEQCRPARLAVSRPRRTDSRDPHPEAESAESGVLRCLAALGGSSAAMISTARTPKATARGRAPSATAGEIRRAWPSAPGAAAPNLTVLTDAAGHRAFASRAAARRAWKCGRRRQRAGARTTRSLLCAGAVQSPQVLMLSGIGPAQHLQALGIAVKARPRPASARTIMTIPRPPIALEMRNTDLLRLLAAHPAARAVEPRSSMRSRDAGRWRAMCSRLPPSFAATQASTARTCRSCFSRRDAIPATFPASAWPWLCPERRESVSEEPWRSAAGEPRPSRRTARESESPWRPGRPRAAAARAGAVAANSAHAPPSRVIGPPKFARAGRLGTDAHFGPICARRRHRSSSGRQLPHGPGSAGSRRCATAGTRDRGAAGRGRRRYSRVLSAATPMQRS